MYFFFDATIINMDFYVLVSSSNRFVKNIHNVDMHIFVIGYSIFITIV